MAYEILKNNDYISNYVQSEEDKDIILNAVKKHNKIKLELTNDYKKDFIAMLVRDADKIDILDSHYKLTNNSLYLYRGFLDDDGKLSEKQFEISDILIEDIINHRLCSNANVKCYFDTILRELAFTFDLNFKSSFQVLLDENIIDDKIAILRKYNTKDTEKINLIEKTLKEFVNSKLKED